MTLCRLYLLYDALHLYDPMLYIWFAYNYACIPCICLWYSVCICIWPYALYHLYMALCLVPLEHALYISLIFRHMCISIWPHSQCICIYIVYSDPYGCTCLLHISLVFKAPYGLWSLQIYLNGDPMAFVGVSSTLVAACMCLWPFSLWYMIFMLGVWHLFPISCAYRVADLC